MTMTMTSSFTSSSSSLRRERTGVYWDFSTPKKLHVLLLYYAAEKQTRSCDDVFVIWFSSFLYLGPKNRSFSPSNFM
ncbi:hypothetical protein Q3G72_009823 [Acer saccharum]|nr:hypothetical protein Q3G72_009823 [Acer saccharum]